MGAKRPTFRLFCLRYKAAPLPCRGWGTGVWGLAHFRPPSLLLELAVYHQLFIDGPVRLAPDPATVHLAVYIRPFVDLPVRIAPDPVAVLLVVYHRPFHDIPVRKADDPVAVPLAAMLQGLQKSRQRLPIVQFDVPPLARQQVLELRILLWCNFHTQTTTYLSVSTLQVRLLRNSMGSAWTGRNSRRRYEVQ